MLVFAFPSLLPGTPSRFLSAYFCGQNPAVSQQTASFNPPPARLCLLSLSRFNIISVEEDRRVRTRGRVTKCHAAARSLRGWLNIESRSIIRPAA